MAAPPERTVRDIIEKAYLKIGVYATGETINADDMNDGLLSFQDMIAEWASDGFLLPSTVHITVPIVADQAVYTIGEDSADVDTVRPNQIITAFIRQGDTDYPVRIIGQKAFAGFSDKLSPGDRPEYLWYNPTVPNGMINLYRMPGSDMDLYITAERAFADGAGLTNDIMLDLAIPRNYHSALVYNLALELATENEREPSVLVAVKADEGMRKIRSLNAANKVNAIAFDFVNARSGNNDLVRY